METFNPDPKPGRVVLPLVLIGMIATTYTFINRVATNNDLDLVAEETPVETIPEEVVVEDTSTKLQLLPFQTIMYNTLKKLVLKKFKRPNWVKMY